MRLWGFQKAFSLTVAPLSLMLISPAVCRCSKEHKRYLVLILSAKLAAGTQRPSEDSKAQRGAPVSLGTTAFLYWAELSSAEGHTPTGFRHLELPLLGCPLHGACRYLLLGLPL